jgi:AAA domain
MPRMNQPSESNSLAKLLLIGDGKLGKSHYSALAAKAGFNVLYFDGDVASATISGMVKNKILTPTEASRIYLLDVCDTLLDGRKDSKFFDVMVEFTTSTVFRWNDSQRRIAKRSDTADEIWEIKPARLDHNCVFIADSWTALCESIMTAAANAHSVDLANATTHEMRPVYQSGGLKSTQMLQLIRSLRCHVIVLGHPDEYSHTTKPEGKKVKDIRETDLIVDWTKMIPKSTSKPQGLQLAKYFTDVAWMESNATGSERLVNFKMSDSRVSGGHFKERKNVDEYSFANLVKEIGGELPRGDVSTDSWLTITPPGTGQTEQSAIAESKVLDGTAGTAIKSAGLASLFAKASTPVTT